MARRKIDLAHAVVADVANEKPAATGIHCKAVRLAQLCTGRFLAAPLSPRTGLR